MFLSLLRASSPAARSCQWLPRHARSLPCRWSSSSDSPPPDPAIVAEEPVIVKKRGRPSKPKTNIEGPKTRSRKRKVTDDILDNPPDGSSEVSAHDESKNLPEGYAALPPLPPLDEWRTLFPLTSFHVRDRISIRNPESATEVAREFLRGEQTKTDQPKIVIEAFPGPGTLSRALMSLPPHHMSKLIILEDWVPYLEYLKPLEKVDPRVKVVPYSGFIWDTYKYLEELGLLEDVETVPWDENIHPRLHFISHIPQSVAGEQLVAQLLRHVPEKYWLFKYGRVPMSFLMSDWVWRRASAPVKSQERCKLSVVAEATSDLSIAVPPEALVPFDDHFHPARNNPKAVAGSPRRRENRRVGYPFVAVNTIPHETQFIGKGKLDIWDYVLRRLFVLRSTPLKNAFGSLAPGAQSLIKYVTDPQLPPEQQVDVSKLVRDLSVEDWALIMRAFEEWPFAPDDLSIDSFQSPDDR